MPTEKHKKKSKDKRPDKTRSSDKADKKDRPSKHLDTPSTSDKATKEKKKKRSREMEDQVSQDEKARQRKKSKKRARETEATDQAMQDEGEKRQKKAKKDKKTKKEKDRKIKSNEMEDEEDQVSPDEWTISQCVSRTPAPLSFPSTEELRKQRSVIKAEKDEKLAKDQERYTAYNGPFSQEAQFQEAGITLKTGRFSEKEDKRVVRAIQLYLDDHQLNAEYLFLLTNKFKQTNTQHHGAFSDFWRTILYEIPDRMYDDAIRHIKRMMHPGNRHGTDRWTALEDRQLLE